MARKILVTTLVFSLLWLAGCKKDAEIGSILKDLDSFTAEIVQKVDSVQGSIEGVDAAQAFLDSKKNDLKKKLDVVKGARGFQVSDETKKKLTASFTKNITAVASLQLKYVARAIKDPRYKAKIEKLISDYRDLLAG